jgi:hypothetical protein
VTTLKKVWTETPVPAGVSADEWHELYSSTLVELLAIYFGEQAA